MWHIKNFEIRKTVLDFTSSEEGFFEVSQMIYENTVLMNAIELMEFENDAVQLIICDCCGIVNCSSGNWVSFRKSGEYILLIPVFYEIEADEDSATEYAPPTFYDKTNHKKRKDTPYFDLATYKNLRNNFPKFPAIEKIKNLKMSEAMRLAQFNMPIRIFGKPPEVFIHSRKLKLVAGASAGEPLKHLQKIEEILKSNYENNSPALIRKTLPDEEIIYLFLDASEFIDWQALVRKGENYFLMLEENFVIESRI